MSEKMSRPERLRSVREWPVRQLRRTDGTVAELERQEVAAVRAARTPREQARRAIAGNGTAACPYHRPDTELGAP
ncbi:DUF6233 domain-containing protein [Streptomyces sp. NPDC002187]|uniref:DUF6233 domain-containing protein n=2 Tax=unclassified Streptomyces TaxID=2593676 RepID=UPI0036785E8A